MSDLPRPSEDVTSLISTTTEIREQMRWLNHAVHALLEHQGINPSEANARTQLRKPVMLRHGDEVVFDPVCLDDLPQHRQDTLLWRYAYEFDYDGVDQLVRDTSPYECPWRRGPGQPLHEEPSAVWGTDGRYHLCLDGHPFCAHRRWRRRNDPPGLYRHEESCSWWKDRNGYRLNPPAGQEPDKHPDHHRTVRWTFQLTTDTCDPSLVPHVGRCTIPELRVHWPAYNNPHTTVGRLRIALGRV